MHGVESLEDLGATVDATRSEEKAKTLEVGDFALVHLVCMLLVHGRRRSYL
jgi:uncharacterized protein YjbJ (UPF0337 family)